MVELCWIGRLPSPWEPHDFQQKWQPSNPLVSFSPFKNLWASAIPTGSMVLVYMLTFGIHLGYIDGKYSIYGSYGYGHQPNRNFRWTHDVSSQESKSRSSSVSSISSNILRDSPRNGQDRVGGSASKAVFYWAVFKSPKKTCGWCIY